jgi:hypothetical protein
LAVIQTKKAVQESFLREEIGGQVELTLVIVTQAKKQNRSMLVNEKMCDYIRSLLKRRLES